MVDAVRLPANHARTPIFENWKLLLFWPAYGLAFYCLEWIIPRPHYYPMIHPLDREIPFVELFVIPYVFWYVYLAGSVIYTFFRDKAAFRRAMSYYILVFGISTVVFALYPTCQYLRPSAPERDNILTRIVFALYSMDTSTNVCPSLHVSGAIGAALAFADMKRFSGRGWKVVNFLIASSICLSTMFIKQHSVIDVFWGLMLSAAAWFVVYYAPVSSARGASRRPNYNQ